MIVVHKMWTCLVHEQEEAEECYQPFYSLQPQNFGLLCYLFEGFIKYHLDSVSNVSVWKLSSSQPPLGPATERRREAPPMIAGDLSGLSSPRSLSWSLLQHKHTLIVIKNISSDTHTRGHNWQSWQNTDWNCKRQAKSFENLCWWLNFPFLDTNGHQISQYYWNFISPNYLITGS